MNLIDYDSMIAGPAEWLRIDGPNPAKSHPDRIDPASPAFLRCRAITRAAARNFYLGLRLAPEPRRSALMAIYTWMRHADNLADDPIDHTGAPRPPEVRRQALADLGRQVVDMSLRGHFGTAEAEPPEYDWWPAFDASMRAFPIPTSVCTEMLEALEADVAGVDLASTRDLAEYTDRVAGTAGAACLAIWGVRRPEFARRAATMVLMRGRAVQLTNILRDLREDLESSPLRSYLPRESYDAFGLTPDSLLAWREPARCEAMIAHWVGQARALYREAADLESLIQPTCARVSWAMAAVYRSLLERIARDPARVVRERIRVPRPRKAHIALVGWLGVGLPG